MSKITYENIWGKVTIVNRLSYPETINERVCTALASGMFEGCLPVCVQQNKKETRVECVVQGLIPLTHYFGGIITKKAFLAFVLEIATLIKNCEKNMMDANNLELQGDKIFIDPVNKRVKCIFWPIVNNQRESSPQLFLKQLPYNLNFSPYEPRDYLDTYNAFFSGMAPFSVNNFERMVLKLLGKRTTGGLTTPSESLSGAMTGEVKREKKEIASNKKSNIEYDPFADDPDYNDDKKEEIEIKHETNGIECSSCGTENNLGAKFCQKCGNKLTNNKQGKPVYPVLIRLKTEESYSVNKPMFRIGAEKSCCDIVLSNNNFISRNHADIITRNDRYYIVDRNSTNKTFVDGKVIPAEKEVEIFSGTKLRLANEDFAFTIES
ncbi:MAG: FHA domain-containing protein [Clostridia bacterium]|nr:FHA domain-containing protein [Clostridia bacterium]